jgi:hypothetical protein
MGEVKVNFSENDMVKVIETFPLEVFFNKVVITTNTMEPDGDLVLSDNTMDEEQYVVAVGNHVSTLKPGDKVIVDLEKMMVKVPNPENSYEYITSIKIDPIETINGIFAMIDDRLIKAKFKTV